MEAAEDWDENVMGGRVVKQAVGLFDRLSDVGTERDSAGNRHLRFSHFASLVLLSFFNPTMQSLRGMQRASEFQRVQKLLGGGRCSLGSLSESVRVFAPAHLEPIIQELIADLPSLHPGLGPDRTIPPDLSVELAQKLVAVDGSSLRALPQIVSMAGKAEGEGKWKLETTSAVPAVGWDAEQGHHHPRPGSRRRR